MPRVLLIHPPVVRPSEPPPGIAKLAGALTYSGVNCTVVDANIEGLLYVLKHTSGNEDTWSTRALAHLEKNLVAIRSLGTFLKIDRYRQAVFEINRILALTSNESTQIQLANYHTPNISPTNSQDLISVFKHPELSVFYHYFQKRMAELLKLIGFDIIGISVNFLTQAISAFAIIGVIRRIRPEVKIFVGGGLITSWMNRISWKNPFDGIIDELVSGPGEAVLLSALGIKTDHRWAIPEYSHFPRQLYLSPGFVIPFAASTGCYWRKCAFCPEYTEKKPYRPLPSKLALSQLKTLSNTYRPSLIHLTDNAISPLILNGLIKDPIGVPWYGFTRITSELSDRDYCEALKRSGCVMLQIGLESGSQKVLDAFGKGINLEKAKKALLNLRTSGIATYVYLLFGTPWEKENDAEDTFNFTVEQSTNISFLNLSIFNLPADAHPQIEINSFSIDDGDLFVYKQFEHQSGWNRQKVRRFLDRKFKRHPEIGAILRRDPPVFTSSHAPFFHLSHK